MECSIISGVCRIPEMQCCTLMVDNDALRYATLRLEASCLVVQVSPHSLPSPSTRSLFEGSHSSGSIIAQSGEEQVGGHGRGNSSAPLVHIPIPYDTSAYTMAFTSTSSSSSSMDNEQQTSSTSSLYGLTSFLTSFLPSASADEAKDEPEQATSEEGNDEGKEVADKEGGDDEGEGQEEEAEEEEEEEEEPEDVSAQVQRARDDAALLLPPNSMGRVHRLLPMHPR